MKFVSGLAAMIIFGGCVSPSVLWSKGELLVGASLCYPSCSDELTDNHNEEPEHE